MSDQGQKAVSTETAPLNNLTDFSGLPNLTNLSPIPSNSPDSSASHSNGNSVPNTASNSNSTPTPTQPIPKKSQQIKTDKPRPHSCSICTRAFARLEHLKRHERSHTNEKPFQCAACGRCFARRDLVLRHQQKLHTHLPNIMRRNSKDTETVPNLNNEHIIVLRNNTSANAPLPNGSEALDEFKLDPVFNTEVFSQSSSKSKKARTPILNPKEPDQNLNQISGNHNNNSNHKRLFPRHSSYSAASSSSYTTLKDSNFNMIKEESNIGNVEFSTPQSHQNFDLNFDWNNIESLDLNNTNHNTTNPGYPTSQNQAQAQTQPQLPANYDLDLNHFNNMNSMKRRKFEDMSPSQTTPNYATPNSNIPTSSSNIPNSKLRTSSFDLSVTNRRNSHRNDGDDGLINHDPLNSNDPLGDIHLNYSGPESAPPSHQTPSNHTPVHHTPGIHGPPSVSSVPSAPPSHQPSISNTSQPPQQPPSQQQIPSHIQQHQQQAVSFNHPKSHHGHPMGVSNPGSISGPSGQVPSSQSPSYLNHVHHISNTPSIPSAASSSVPGHLVAERESISENGDWLQEIINTPYEPNFNQLDETNFSLSGVGSGTITADNRNHTNHNVGGASNDPHNSFHGVDISLGNSSHEISSLFKSRQLDLTKHLQLDLHSNPLPPPLPEPSNMIKQAAKLGQSTNDDMNHQVRQQPGNSQLDNYQEMLYHSNNNDQNLDLNLPYDKRDYEFNDMNLFDSSAHDNNRDDFGHIISNGHSEGFITEELRNRVITISNLSDLQFPSLEDLNNYMKLYEREFNKYFPFIHLPSLKNPMVDNFENIPLLLSMASIGALYSYHDANTLLLFNLSKFHIQNFFEKEVTLDNLQFKKVPLMAHQCLVLHIFISMFLNEPPMIDITSRQMKSMVGLIKSTNFHKPLDQFLIPPSSITNSSDKNVVQNNFDYFIMTQSRIRAIFVFYMLQQFRTSTLLELSILLNISNINNGSYCINESLWKSENSEQWVQELRRLNLLDDDSTKSNESSDESNKFSIISLSNSDNINDLIKDLHNHETNTREIKYPLNLNNLLMLLIYVHERIQQQFETHKSQANTGGKRDYKDFDYVNWRLNSENLQELIKSWEFKFIKNNGVLIINDSNNHLLNEHHELKLILPLYHFAKIKISVNLTPIIERIVHKDWENMNNYLNLLHLDFDGLKMSINYCLDTMNLWIQNIKVVNNYKENSLRTPVFFVTCVFVSLLLISQFLYYIEQINDKDHGIYLGITEKTLWLKCEETLKNCEKILSLNYHSEQGQQDQQHNTKNNKNLHNNSNKDAGIGKHSNQSQNKARPSGGDDRYSSGGFKPLNGIEDIEYENYESIRKLIKNNSNSKLIVNSLKLIKLSNKCLFLGVRILADAPIWPLAMGFAEALKNRANYISKI